MSHVINADILKNYSFAVSTAGRINIIGEHIDYCGGKVFPAALSLKNTVYIRPNATNQINLCWTTLDEKVTLDINKLDTYKNLKYGNYQAGAVYYLQKAGYKVLGCDILSDCTVPFGSGLSSSAAIEVSTIKALLEISGQSMPDKDIALLAQKTEINYAGVNCGIMDQFASACGKKDMAMVLDCKTLDYEYVPFVLGDYALAIVNCNKPHNLVESKYNERRRETDAALAILKTALDIDCLADLRPDDLEKHKNLLNERLYKRVKHVVEECERVNLAKKALICGDIIKLGQLLNQSHHSLDRLYDVAGLELNVLQAVLTSFNGCIGARMVGGGFGGCCIALVEGDRLDEFKKFVADGYSKITNYAPSFYDATIADGIVVQNLNN